jgi:ectoine hydroxylase-related dioxygenase (phytanoyl-CoA dioxygenase family)
VLPFYRRGMDIPRLPSTTTGDAIATAIREAGVVIIEDAISPDKVELINRDLQPYLDRLPPNLGSFLGLQSRRMGRLLTKSKHTWDLVMHPPLLAALDELFRNEAYFYQLHLTQISSLGPGQKAQSIHRDDTVFPFKHPCPPYFITSNWALTDFTAANGATLFVPGSHQWDDVRRPEPGQQIPAEMKAGSFALWTGATWHQSGTNTTDTFRTGILNGYTLGWLKQEENMALAYPPRVAKHFPPKLLDLIGYRCHGYLGWYEGQDPKVTFQAEDGLPEDLPADDLYTAEFESIKVRLR